MQFILSIFILSILVFYMSRLAPGDPLKSYYGESAERMSVQERAAAVEKLGLNNPIFVQYGKWMISALHGDFGISYKYKQDVMAVIGSVYQNTLLLGGISFVITFVLALLLGIFCTIYEDKLMDRILCRCGAVINCIPSFWLSLLLILVFSINLGWLPSSGAYTVGRPQHTMGRISHMVLPSAVLVLSHLWYYAFMVRNILLDEVRKDYVLFCRMKGLSRCRTVVFHCLRNIMPSYLSMMTLAAPHILGGTYIVEKVFSYPGLGSLVFESAKYHDYNMLLVLSLLTGLLVIAANMLSQIISEGMNPSIRHDRCE